MFQMGKGGKYGGKYGKYYDGGGGGGKDFGGGKYGKDSYNQGGKDAS